MIKTLNIEKLAKLLLISLAFAPLIVAQSALFPFIFGKTFYLRLTVAFFWTILALFVFSKRGKEFLAKLNFKLFEDRIFLSVLSYVGLAFVSTLMAPNMTRAIFGTIERGEGYVNLVVLLALLIGTLLIFDKKNWLAFMALSVLTGSLVALDAVVMFIITGWRPNGSFIGNPAFIAAYLIFVIFAGLVVLAYENRRYWRYAVYLAMFFTVAGLAVANARGAFVGIFAGIIVASIYLAKRAGKVKLRGVRMRRLAIAILISITVFISIFGVTFQSFVWDKVPGLNRLSEISFEDSTVQSRLISAKISFDSIRPSNEGWQRTLFGWGPDNFNIAFNKYFDPSFQKYETKWFDRAHNKLVDVMTMHGLLGLMAFMSIWFFVFRFAFKRVEEDNERLVVSRLLTNIAILFFATAYFVQNLFLFDQVTTYVPLFMFLGFVIYLDKSDKPITPVSSRCVLLIKYLFASFAFLFVIFFIYNSVVPAIQMKPFFQHLRTKNLTGMMEDIDKITLPYNYAQAEIRFQIFSFASTNLNAPGALPLINKSVALIEEVIVGEPLDPKYPLNVSYFYEIAGDLEDRLDYVEIAEEKLRGAIKLAPGRQDLHYTLAQYLISQGKLEEAKEVTRELIALEPDSTIGRLYETALFSPIDWNGEYQTTEKMEKLFLKDRVAFEGRYLVPYRRSRERYLKYFYKEEDPINFRKTLVRAIEAEELLVDIQLKQVKDGLIQGVQDSNVDNLKKGLIIFDTVGFSGINF
ncbi:O-antigen ligase family protein [Patescibacteria group bacterium]|nr:O-antigen ligase family protein [Patescibacteria group bacterium]